MQKLTKTVDADCALLQKSTHIFTGKGVAKLNKQQ